MGKNFNKIVRALYTRQTPLVRCASANGILQLRDIQRSWRASAPASSAYKFQSMGLLLLILISVFLAFIKLEAVGGLFEDQSLSFGLIGRAIGGLHRQLAHGKPDAPVVLQGNVGFMPLDKQQEKFTCDRSHWRYDLCLLQGDIRIRGRQRTINLLGANDALGGRRMEYIQPFPGKKYPESMKRVAAVTVRRLTRREKRSSGWSACQKKVEVPAVVFSMGGLLDETEEGSMWHDFSDILVPLYLTTYSYNRRVVLIVHQIREWFLTKYSKFLDAYTDQPILRLEDIDSTWCFRQVVVGLVSPGPLYVAGDVEAGVPPNQQDLLARWAQSVGVAVQPPRVSRPVEGSLQLGVIRREKTRVITPEAEARLLVVAAELGFDVEMVNVETTPVAQLLEKVQGFDALLGVLGPGLANLIFLRPNSVIINIVPWGLDTQKWDIAFAAGRHLQYVECLLPRGESSLVRRFLRNHTVFTNPSKQWEIDPSVMLSQNLNLSSSTAFDILDQAKFLLTTSEEERL